MVALGVVPLDEGRMAEKAVVDDSVIARAVVAGCRGHEADLGLSLRSRE